MKLRDELREEYGKLAKKPDIVFIGQGLINAGRVYGTMDDVPEKKCIEMPICENLIVGCAIGLALKGLRPICVFQRHDFLLCAADAIINHLCKMEKMSGGQFNLPVIIRAIVGSQSTKFDVGLQHKMDYSEMFSSYIEVYDVTPDKKGTSMAHMYKLKHPALLVEHKDDYEREVK